MRTFIFLVILTFSTAKCSVLFEEVAKFCIENGYKFVTFIDSSTGLKEAYKYGLRARYLNLESAELDQEMDFAILQFNLSKTEHYLNYIHTRKIRRSLIILPSDELEIFLRDVENLMENSYFYLASLHEEKSLKWHFVITLKHSSHVIVNDLIFDEQGRIIEKYDLQGHQIVATSLSWSPYIKNENCDESGRNCTNTGLLVDFMQIWARDFNFTWDIYADVDGDWGINPVSGPYNISGEWKGNFSG